MHSFHKRDIFPFSLIQSASTPTLEMETQKRLPAATLHDQEKILCYNSYYFRVTSKDLTSFNVETIDGITFKVDKECFINLVTYAIFAMENMESAFQSGCACGVAGAHTNHVIYDWLVSPGPDGQEWRLIGFKSARGFPQIMLALYGNENQSCKFQPPTRAGSIHFPPMKLCFNPGNRWHIQMGLSTGKFPTCFSR